MQYKFYITFLIGITFILFFNPLFSQEKYQNIFVNILVKDRDEIHNHNNSSNFGLIGFYKNYISSQDFGSCPYSPSCSIYAYQAIKKHGIFRGLIMGFDRLSRCNRYQETHYEHNEQNKLIDKP